MLTVTAYNARQKGWTMPENLYQWNPNAVIKILERQEYMGCTVNFKTYTKSLKFEKRMENPRENQRIFEGTQPAIIEMGQWERIQALRENKRRPTKTGKTSIFPALSAVRIAGQSFTSVPAIPTRTIPRTTSSAPTTRATPAPVKSTISGRSRFTNGYWNVFKER